jgi:ATP/maltotriose-dependent transcriptional regulator MalT
MFRARSYNTIGWLRGDLGDIAGSIEWNERCLQFLREVDIPDEEVQSNAHLNLADVHLRAGLLDRAAVELAAVEEINAGRPVRGSWMLWRFRQRHLLLQTELRLRRGEGGLDGRHAEALQLATESGSRKYVGRAALVEAQAMIGARVLDGAAERAEHALEVAAAIGHPPDVWRARSVLAEIAAGRGDADAAHAHRRAADDGLAAMLHGLVDPACRAGVASLRAALG